MSLMLDKWTPAQAKKKLTTRLQSCREWRTGRLDRQWERNERTVFNVDGSPAWGPAMEEGLGAMLNSGAPDAEVTASTGVNYSFKNVRFIHAQMSSNPPTTVPRPGTSDPEDRRRARAADQVMRFALRQYGLQEKFDQCNLNALIYGSGFIKTTWDTSRGEILGIRKTGQLLMEGDISIKSVSPWKVFLDPDAETWEEVRYLFEEVTISYEEAIHRWPKKKELINSLIDERSGTTGSSDGAVMYSYLHGDSQQKRESIKVYEYWERGLPSNAMLGRYAVVLEDGRVMEGPKANPFSFSPPPSSSDLKKSAKTGREPRKVPPTARLPYHMMTDVDVPNRVWGKSFVEFEAPLQELLNRLDSVMLENLQAHGVARLILPDGMDLAEGAITNSPWDILRTKGDGGGKDPKFMEPMPLPQALTQLREQTKSGIDDMAGVNESMFGQQSREQSGFSMQYAANQGNMIRRRLFNKYVILTESVYRAILDLVRKHWKDERTIQVLGREKAFQALDLKGSDVDGGYDLVVEYGSSLSLDPMTRRQEILNLQPILEKAQIPPRIILSMLKLGELDVVDDLIQMAEDRQREIFEEMFADGVYIKPEEYQDHENMIAYALRFVMTSEFKYLEPDEKQMVRQHIKDRGAQAAQEQAQPGGAPGAAPGAPAPMGAPGVPPGPGGAPAQVPGAPAVPASPAPAGAVTQPADQTAGTPQQ